MRAQPGRAARSSRQPAPAEHAGETAGHADLAVGPGPGAALQPFAEVYGKRGAIISAVDLVRGVGMLLGWTRIDVPGATGYLDTDYAAKGRYGVEALEDSRPGLRPRRGAGRGLARGQGRRQGQGPGRDRPAHRRPAARGAAGAWDWRILVSPDHRTPLRTRAPRLRHGPFRGRRHRHRIAEAKHPMTRRWRRRRDLAFREGASADAVVSRVTRVPLRGCSTWWSARSASGLRFAGRGFYA